MKEIYTAVTGSEKERLQLQEEYLHAKRLSIAYMHPSSSARPAAPQPSCSEVHHPDELASKPVSIAPAVEAPADCAPGRWKVKALRNGGKSITRFPLLDSQVPLPTDSAELLQRNIIRRRKPEII